MSNIQVLLLIAAFLTVTIGSFVYYIATWDADAEQPVSIILPKILPPEASAVSKGARA